jgi:imidazolonepropionase-like amidohydrolase
MAALDAMVRSDADLARDDRVALVPGGPDRLRALASTTPQFAPSTRFFFEHAQALKALVDAGGRLVAATDPRVGFQGLTLHAELQQLAGNGFTNEQALRAATSDAAAALGIDDAVGTIAPGKLADLVFLDGDPLADIRATRRVKRVMRGGRLYNVPDLLK